MFALKPVRRETIFGGCCALVGVKYSSSTSMGSGGYGSDFVAGGIGNSHCDIPCCCSDRALANMIQKVRLHISCITRSTSIGFGPSRPCPLDVILAGGAGPGRGIPMIVFGLCAPTVVNIVRHRLKYRMQDGLLNI